MLLTYTRITHLELNFGSFSVFALQTNFWMTSENKTSTDPY